MSRSGSAPKTSSALPFGDGAQYCAVPPGQGFPVDHVRGCRVRAHGVRTVRTPRRTTLSAARSVRRIAPPRKVLRRTRRSAVYISVRSLSEQGVQDPGERGAVGGGEVARRTPRPPRRGPTGWRRRPPRRAGSGRPGWHAGRPGRGGARRGRASPGRRRPPSPTAARCAGVRTGHRAGPARTGRARPSARACAGVTSHGASAAAVWARSRRDTARNVSASPSARVAESPAPASWAPAGAREHRSNEPVLLPHDEVTSAIRQTGVLLGERHHPTVPAVHRHRRGEGAGPRGLAAPDRAPVRPAPLVRSPSSPRSSSRRPSSRWPHRSCCAPSSTSPCRSRNLSLLGLAGHRHGRRRRRDLRARRRPDLDLAPRSASRSCTGCAPTCSRTCSASRSRFFTRTRTGEVQSRITNDIGGMQSVVTSTATSIASNLTTAVATAVAMVALSWRLSLISLVVLPPSICLTRRVARMRRAITAQRQRELADLNVTIDEGLSISGVQLSQDHRHRPRAGRAVHRLVGPADRPGAALAARRPLADGLDEHRLRRDPRGHLPRRGPAGRRPAR